MTTHLPRFIFVLGALFALPTLAPAEELTEGDFDRHVEKLRDRLPGGDFHIVVEPPFVVVGDESADMVRRRATGTVRWAVERIRDAYFEEDPDEILEIWLFKDRESYEKHTRSVFDDEPGTPFGYYSPRHKALIMNISTGGGTLVHEIVHPFMAANFPACPAWFNEGLASLYEQCRDNDGKIWGLTNWRLRGLQQAIRAKRVPPFKELCGTTRREFYNEDRGTNYAQARYLCYYLQHRGLLRKYYHAFRAASADDPTGYHTLRRILNQPDMDQFQSDWEKFILDLRF